MTGPMRISGSLPPQPACEISRRRISASNGSAASVRNAAAAGRRTATASIITMNETAISSRSRSGRSTITHAIAAAGTTAASAAT